MALRCSGRLGVGNQVETGGCMVEDGWRLKEELHVGSICQRVEVGRSSRGTLVHTEDAYIYSGLPVDLDIEKT